MDWSTKAPHEVGLHIRSERVQTLGIAPEVNNPLVALHVLEAGHDMTSHVLTFRHRVSIVRITILFGATSCCITDHADVKQA